MLNKLLQICFVIINSVTILEGLVPNVCVHNATKSGICCPISKWSHEICGGPKRGICDYIKYPNEAIPEIFEFDDRVEWPKRFFHSVCHCKGNFYGIACDECWFGWTGPKCNERILLIRRNIKNLSPKDKYILNKVIDLSLYFPSGYSVYIDQVNRNNDPLTKPTRWIPATIQYMLVFIHRVGSRATMFEDYLDCQNFGILNFNHEAVGFITWHRLYMLIWERLLQNIAKKEFGIYDFSLPYWDWTDQSSCDICTDDMAGAPGIRDINGLRIGRPNPFSNWTEFCVEPDNPDESPCYGCHVTGTYGSLTREWNSVAFPTTEDVQFVLSKRQFFVPGERVSDDRCDSFHRALEGMCGPPDRPSDLFYMHNKIHNMIDGSMCCSGTAPSDPLFIFHHTQTDRIFEEYFNRYQPSLDEFPDSSTRPGHSRNSYLTAILPLITHAQMFKNSKHLGYTYDNFKFGKLNKQLDSNTRYEENKNRPFIDVKFEEPNQW